MARCAATPSTCELANEVAASTTVARAGGQGELRQQIPVAFDDDIVHQVFGRERQDEAGEPIDHHQREAQAEPVRCAQMSPRASSHAPAVSFDLGLAAGLPGAVAGAWSRARRDPCERSAPPLAMRVSFKPQS